MVEFKVFKMVGMGSKRVVNTLRVSAAMTMCFNKGDTVKLTDHKDQEKSYIVYKSEHVLQHEDMSGQIEYNKKIVWVQEE